MTGNEKVNILDLNADQLKDFIINMGEKGYRASQILEWIQKDVLAFDEMSNLPQELREKLKKLAYLGHMKLGSKTVSGDGTVKYLFVLPGGHAVESVLMQYKYGYSVCISSQVGCRMNCRFCASTGIGFERNLTPGEMYEQVLQIRKDIGSRISNIVVMGIGEPLDNYDNLVSFINLAVSPKGLGIGNRHITISTCGVVPAILKLADEPVQVRLSVSLHAPNDDIRGKIMPINKKYSIDKIIEACKIYTRKTRKRITFEYILIHGLNDSPHHSVELAARLRELPCLVNLIQLNEVKHFSYERSPMECMKLFQDTLMKHGITATLRRRLGADINAACGQLRRSLFEDGE